MGRGPPQSGDRPELAKLRGVIAVRQGTTADLAACTAIAVALRGEDPERASARFTHDLERGGRLYVAEVDGAFAGYGRLVEITDGDAPHGPYLMGLLVAEAHRGRGVGEALTRARMDAALERAGEVWYFANSRNGASLRLHERLGFAEVQRPFAFPGVTFADGVGVLCRRGR
jgi:ribosomal protein S18 acetylase RimI-like enzyme